MTPAARIQAVIDILAEILTTPRPADTLTSTYFRERRFIGSKDRAAINTRLYRIMRSYHRLSWWIRQKTYDVNARTLVIASLIFDKEHNFASICRTFSGEKYAPEELTAAEKKLAEKLESHILDTPEMPLQARLECPEWAFDPLRNTLGERLEKELISMLEPAPMDIRVNTLKATRDDVLEQLKRDGFNVEAGKLSPLAIRIFDRPQIAAYPLFKEGYFEIQDEGSQLVALAADAKPGEQVADFCAGAGGKTLAIGAAMKNKGRIVALDVLGGRLNRAKERFRRAGLHNIETRELTSERDKFVKHHLEHFDLVLADAPCTGTGTWRRDPDKRWRQLGPGLSSLVELQKNILESACRMVKPGGRLVYATCSLLPEENQLQIERFLNAHPEFTVSPVDSKISKTQPYLQVTPAENNTDGFFAAVLVKKK